MIEPFHRLFPDLAAQELHMLELWAEGEAGALPAGAYLFVESYCTNPDCDCDCERVVIAVGERKRGIVASIAYEFNASPAPPFFDKSNPVLDREVRQSEYAADALALFKEKVISAEFNERLRQHYRLMKAVGVPRNSRRPAMRVARQIGGASGPSSSENNKKPPAKIGGDERTASPWPFPTISASSAPVPRFACLATRLWLTAPA